MDFLTWHEDRFVIPAKVCYHVYFCIYFLLHPISRALTCVGFTAIHNLAIKYREDFKLPNLKIPFNNRQGFYFSIPQKSIQGKLPNKFIQVGMLYLNFKLCLGLLLASFSNFFCNSSGYKAR